MFRQALRAALIPKIKTYAPAGLVDTFGRDGLQVFFEQFELRRPAADGAQGLGAGVAVAVLYAVDDIERLVAHINAEPILLAHAEGGLRASGHAVFQNLKEGLVQGVAYAELRFAIAGAIAPV